MQDQARVSLNQTVVRRPVTLHVVSPCLVSLLALAASACASDYPVGNLAEQSQLVGLVPEAQDQRPTGSADNQLDPLLSPADVTLAARGGIQVKPTGVGDVDGDGYGDFAVTGFDDSLLIAYVHLRYGGPAPIEPEDQFALAESGARLAFEESSPRIESIGPVGDVNGDGFADLIVTATVCDDLLPGGGAYLLYGGPDRLNGATRIGDVATHLKLPFVREGQESCGTLTNAPFGLGDIDADGLSDFVLVSYQSPDYSDPAQLDAPTVTNFHLFYGREEPIANDATWLDADSIISAEAESSFAPRPLGDVTADGRADFAFGTQLGGFYWVPGSADRLSGEVDARAAFATLACADEQCSSPPLAAAGDVDGDGIDDLLAYEASNRAHLFYGASGLLEGGVLDLQTAAASFLDDAAMPQEGLVSSAGDRDGDGDADLLSFFYSDSALLHTDVAFVSGSPTRLTDPQTLPIREAIAARPGGLPFSLVIEHQDHTFEQDRVVFSVSDAGDLNGDGADDLLTTSMYLLSADETGSSYASPQIHIHYGTPGKTVAPAPVR
jgi:hypothetical protein